MIMIDDTSEEKYIGVVGVFVGSTSIRRRRLQLVVVVR